LHTSPCHGDLPSATDPPLGITARTTPFARYRFREELFPSLTFRQAYDALVKWRGERADIEYVRILHLAASTLEGPVERALEALLNRRGRFDYAAVKALAAPEPVAVPVVSIGAVDLTVFDGMLGGGR